MSLAAFLSYATLYGQAPSANFSCPVPETLKAKLALRDDAKSHIELGNWFDGRKMFACAAREYASAAKLNPGSQNVFLLLGSSLLAAGDTKAAESALRKAITLSPSSAEPHEKLAELLEKSKQGDAAQLEWEAALRRDPQSVAALDGISRQLIAQGNYQAAVDLLHSAPKNDDLAIDLARAYAQAGSLKDAESVLRKAVSDNPSSFRLTRALVGVLVDEHTLERTFQEPVEIAEHYATEHPDNLEAQRLYLQMLVAWIPSGAQSADLARATPLARKLLEASPNDPYFLYVNGMLERQTGNYKAAQAHLEKSVALDPNDDRPHYELGLVLAAIDDAAGAEREFRKTLSLGNNQAEVRFQLSKVLRTLGKTDEANQQLKLYSDQTSKASQLRIARLKESQADKALEGDQAAQAVGFLREAIDASPDNAGLHFKLALALDKTGDLSGERAELDKAVGIEPHMAAAHNQLGYLASRSGDSASAEEHFRKAVEAAPAYTEAWINLAATLGMEAKFPEAEQAVAKALKADPKNAAALQLQQDLKAVQH